MGMTNKQFQGFIRLLKRATDETVDKSERNPEMTKEEIINDIKGLSEILQGLLEDGD